MIPTVAVPDVPDPLPDDLTVVDVREDVEWEHGHIAGSLHIPMMEVPGRLGDLPDTRLLVVCRVGSRSARVVQFLAAQGIDAVNLEGGLVDWFDAGRALVSEGTRPPQVV